MAKFNCNFISYTLMRTVDITVVVPSVTIPESMKGGFVHTQADKFPVLYLFHGFGNNHATWTGYTNVELYAEERNIAVVMLSAENKSYINHESGDRFYDFIQNELPDFVRFMFPVSAKPEDTYVAGLSMGGYGAMVHGFMNTDKYAAIGIFSSNPRLGEDRLPDSGSGAAPRLKLGSSQYNIIEAAKKSAAAGGRLPKVYISCGTEDFLIEANRKFPAEFKAMGYDVTYSEGPGYKHEWRFWDQQVEAFLDWLPRTDNFAKAGKRQI